jgi:uridine phosphorylase
MSTKHVGKLPVMQVYPAELAPRAIVVGDPQRVQKIAQSLQSSQKVGDNREYVTYTGEYKGKRVTVCSHGVGSAGASVCFHELIQGGARVIIRAGTCGALQPEINDGSIIIGTAAVREDGTTDRLVPLAYPAFADPSVVKELEEAMVAGGADTIYKGIVLTQAYLYPGLLPTTNETWERAGVLCLEMELAALLVIASLRSVKAGGIFTSDGNLARNRESLSPDSYNPDREVVTQGVHKMLNITLEALIQLSID